MTNDAVQERHNRFIDSIFARINRIVSDNYDPFIVRLNGRASGAADDTKPSKAVTTKKQNNQHVTKKSKNTKPHNNMAVGETSEEGAVLKKTVQEEEQMENGTEETRNRESATNNKQNKKSQVNNNKITNTKDKLKQSNSKASNPKGDGKQVEKLEKSEGSLSGLASLKRVGNVKVTESGGNATIKAKFTLGPLVLRVEKAFKRGSVRNIKSATARTNEMIGRIKFAVVNDRATLMSIKVQQPKQVEVESKDNHDRTREFVWKRTPKIAKLVNEKLKLATETLLTRYGAEIN